MSDKLQYCSLFSSYAALLTAPQDDIVTSAEKISLMVASLTPKGWELYDKVKQFTPENLYGKGVDLLSVDGI